MTIILPSYSEAQIIVLHRTLVRAGEAVPPPGPDFPDWMRRAQMILPAGIHVGQLQSVDPMQRTLEDKKFRTYVLGYMTGFDCFTEGMANALEKLLLHVEEYPNLPIDTRRVRKTLREINQDHRETVHRIWGLVDRAYQRFNENVGLGRPLYIGLDILFDELKEYRVFSGGPRAREELHSLYGRIDQLIAKIRAGKTHPDTLLRSIVNQLEALTTKAFSEVSDYWYSEVMVKRYFRDTLIPHAILNNYIDPQQTSDLLGGVWRFITDLPYDPHLLVCRPLLRHQPQAPGTRFATVADFIDEIQFSRVRPADFPSLKVRIEQKEALISEGQNEQPTLQLLCEHPSIRLSHQEEFLYFMLSKYSQNTSLDPNRLRDWLSKSIFSIDPRNGIPAQSLSTALRLGLARMKEGASIENLDIGDLQDLYLRVLRNKCHNIHEALKYPFSSEYLQEMKRLDQFELREALVDAILEGIYQPASDWLEERELATHITDAIRAVDIAEKEERLDQPKALEEFFIRIEKSLKNLELRAETISFDRPSLRLWQTLCIDAFLTLNQSQKRGLFRLPYNKELMVPVNFKSLEELIANGLKESILVSLKEVATL